MPLCRPWFLGATEIGSRASKPHLLRYSSMRCGCLQNHFLSLSDVFQCRSTSPPVSETHTMYCSLLLYTLSCREYRWAVTGEPFELRWLKSHLVCICRSSIQCMIASQRRITCHKREQVVIDYFVLCAQLNITKMTSSIAVYNVETLY